MNWERVAKYLEEEGISLRERANCFLGSPEVNQEMRTRASIFITFAEAISAGLPRLNPD